MRFLLTAFEPFDGTGVNASLEACRRFLDRGDGGAGEFDLRFVVLPVEYAADTAAVEHALGAEPADVILHTGQASGAAAVRVERIAVNVRYAAPTPAADGRRPTAWAELPQQAIDPAGPARLYATLPVERLAAAIRAAGVPVVVSNRAGIYLCNHVLYRSLRRAEHEAARTGAGKARVGFLHVPRLPQQAGPGNPALPAEEIGRAVEAALRALAPDALFA